VSLGRTLLGAMAFRGWLLENNITGGEGVTEIVGYIVESGESGYNLARVLCAGT